MNGNIPAVCMQLCVRHYLVGRNECAHQKSYTIFITRGQCRDISSDVELQKKNR